MSIDRIGSASTDKPEDIGHALLWEFVLNHDVFRKLAEARTVLSDAFSSETGPDDMDELERELQDVPYWSTKEAGQGGDPDGR